MTDWKLYDPPTCMNNVLSKNSVRNCWKNMINGNTVWALINENHIWVCIVSVTILTAASIDWSVSEITNGRD